MNTIKEIQETLISEFADQIEWEDKYQYLIRLGRDMVSLPEAEKTEKYKIEGCQSQVWIKPDYKSGRLSFQADSDAMIVKGLIAILLKIYSGRTPEEILNNPPEFITRIGIDKHLSPTRKNGLGAMLKQINYYALAYKTMESAGSKQ
ncbi:MAG: SufE family protein [Ignavibacteriales bacterium]|nr:SufE family protein [Ignavibacteriales bacterium]MCF8305429.1 SufE family protein [Ignavibacteriales bacterium]MCF8316112.1 SufE family protein [Ignavibacteriales bacterium]MCF8436614.1 SufE family protein [Ignavibacteriales bacterium]